MKKCDKDCAIHLRDQREDPGARNRMSTDDLILSSYLTGGKDPQRATVKYPPDTFGLIKRWYESVRKYDLRGVIFHDQCSPEWVKKHTCEHVQFTQTPTRRRSCNDYRFTAYLDYLKGCSPEYLLMTDLFDITFSGNPFSFMRKHPKKELFCAAIPGEAGTKRKRMHRAVYGEEINEERRWLLGCIIGGKTLDMIELLKAMRGDFRRAHRSIDANEIVFNKVAYDMFGKERMFINKPFGEDITHRRGKSKALVVHRSFLGGNALEALKRRK